MADVTTLDEMYWPLMELPSVETRCCAICGRTWPLNRHHFVFRSQGQLVRDGRKLKRPTIVLCGQGSSLYGTSPDGTRVIYCHGRAHHKMLHFRNNRGVMEFAEFDEPTSYLDALEDGYWEPLGIGREWIC